MTPFTDGVKVWTSGVVSSDRVLTMADLKAADSYIRGVTATPRTLVMSPRTFDRFKDVLHTEAVRRFLGIVGPFAPITAKSVWRSVVSTWGTFTYRLRKAVRVLRYGYDPEDL